MEISNSGGFIAGITTENILHHQPAARNPLLVEALSRLHLVNRSNLGVGRMFSAFLLEGKRPPSIREMGESVTVTFLKSELQPVFRQFMASLDGDPLSVDELLVLHRLWRQPSVDLEELPILCQLDQTLVEQALRQLSQRGLVEPASDETRSHWRLSATVRAQYPPPRGATPPAEQVLPLLRLHPRQGVAMATIIEETGMSRSAAKRLLEALRADGRVTLVGKGPAARWVIVED
jgi:ATP-dependent DNA helicase RecG